MISIVGDGRLVANATLGDRESVEALVEMLNTVKNIPPPKKQLEPQEQEEDQER